MARLVQFAVVATVTEVNRDAEANEIRAREAAAKADIRGGFFLEGLDRFSLEQTHGVVG